MNTLSATIMSSLPENFNWQSITFTSFMTKITDAYIDLGYPVDQVPTIVFYPGHHHCLELYDGSSLGFATTHDLFELACKVYWIKQFASLSDAKEYVAKLALPSHNDNNSLTAAEREFFQQTKH